MGNVPPSEFVSRAAKVAKCIISQVYSEKYAILRCSLMLEIVIYSQGLSFEKLNLS